MDAIKKDADAGAPLAAMFIAQEVAPNEYELARANRKLKEQSVTKLTETERAAKITTFNMSQATPPPLVTVNNNQYTRTEVEIDDPRFKDAKSKPPAGSYVYEIQYQNGTVRYYTPYDMTLLYEGNPYNSQMNQISLQGFQITPGE